MGYDTASVETMNGIIREVYRHTGITMDASKFTMLKGRLTRRARGLKLASLEGYLEHLERDPSEIGPFIDAVTTNKTLMFRSATIWKYLHDSWLPDWQPTTPRPLLAWSAACSTGQEPASLAMLLGHRAKRDAGFRWQIEASDISPKMVAAAQTQTFAAQTTLMANTRQPDRLIEKWMTTDEHDRMVLDPALRKNMRFYQHNLFESCGLRRFDLIFVRNVIIYFSAQDRDAVIRRLIAALRPNGLLVVGESESLDCSVLPVEMVMHCVYRRPGSL